MSNEQKSKLYRKGGCLYCRQNCCFNGPTALKEMAERTKGKPFGCNVPVSNTVGLFSEDDV